MSETEIVRIVLGLLGPVSAVVTAILVLAVIALGIYLRRYLEQKALQLATREDFRKLQVQVAESTKLVEGIKSELANRDFVRRELHNLRVRKVEELITLALNCEDDMDAFRNASIEGKHYDKPRHHNRMLALAMVYLPELEQATSAYWDEIIDQYREMGDRAVRRANGENVQWDDFFITSNYPKLNAALQTLKKQASNYLQATANGVAFQQPSNVQ